jgi:hypothetical protein
MAQSNHHPRIQERLGFFDDRFASLVARCEALSDHLSEVGAVLDRHIEQAEVLLGMAREAQEAPRQKRGIAAWFARRNQGRINAKLMGIVECDLAVMRELRALQQPTAVLLCDTTVAVRRDVTELLEAVKQNIESLQDSTACSLQLLGSDVELLKQLAARQHLVTQPPCANGDITPAS